MDSACYWPGSGLHTLRLAIPSSYVALASAICSLLGPDDEEGPVAIVSITLSSDTQLNDLSMQRRLCKAALDGGADVQLPMA